MKKMVAYFSPTGTTARLARTLAQATEADLLEIRPETPYTAKDLDWTNPKSRSSREMHDPAFRPALAEPCGDLSGYDTIFLGFPIWWYVAPTLINTFLESGQFSGKTIVLFATSGGSGLGRTADILKPLCPPSVTWITGKVWGADTSAAELSAWVDGLGL